ncbi:MAG: C39 family peptidase [Lachnospiraceae bacterium]|jgi:uncharacterized protein YvpB
MNKINKHAALCIALALALTCTACGSSASGQNSATVTSSSGTYAAASTAQSESRTTAVSTTAEQKTSETGQTESSETEESAAEPADETETAAAAVTQTTIASTPQTEAAETAVSADSDTAQADSSEDTSAAAETEAETQAETTTAAYTPPVYYNTVVYDSTLGEYLFYGSDGTAEVCPTVVIPVDRYIDQVAEGAPMGCEAASLLMALWAKGYCTDMTYQEFLETMPYATDGNPNHGFVGTPYANDGNFDGINMPAVASWGAEYANTADITGCSEEELIYQLYIGHPVVVWTSYQFGPTEPEEYWWGTYKTNGHVMLLCGFNPDTEEFYIADPAPGGTSSGLVWVSWSTFTASFDVMRGAVAVW